jgi:hypothetical protein
MIGFANPWVLLSAFGALVAASATGFVVGSRYERAEHLEAQQLIQQAADAFDAKAAERIAQIRPVHKTIQNKLQETVRENTVYRDCLVDPVTRRLLDAARENRAVGAVEDSVSGAGAGSP